MRLCLVIALSWAFLPDMSQAQEVELKARDGSAKISGELIERTDGHYLIKTPLGLFRFALEDVTCSGDGCEAVTRLEAQPNNPDLAVTVIPGAYEPVLPVLSGIGARLPTAESCAAMIPFLPLEEPGILALLDERYTEARVTSAAEFAQQPRQVAMLADVLTGARKLSSTLRFAANKGELGKQSQESMEGLLEALDGKARDVDILVLGFADTSGDYESNLRLSAQRAQAIASVLEDGGLAVDLAAGFGEESPITCNESAESRAHNRRVEVWLKAKP